MITDENSQEKLHQDSKERYLLEVQKLQVKREVHWEIIESILTYTEEKSKSDSVSMAMCDIAFNLFEAHYQICKEIITLRISGARRNSKHRHTEQTNPD
ncbi:hypothetical protein J23TS9_05300 [Paenibacillus sp. J23TS9]|uniref:hypothetical protein n=1 Tax=Paenibacillus sp. J23TS9 TaxID=2807193 RepID=UPI001B1C73DD|nr:hypothetical protein [Paenibacillus sp. J23TS9]GIP25400.1 hypothetical protein J23TS9_05300 [Paenibacillus sp. J23TS9]